MKKPIVSIIIPTYNRLNYLKEALSSVKKQSYSNYEIIVCDDCSSDGTKEFLRSYQKTEKRLRYYRNAKNMGMVANWNAGLKRVRGKYVAILNDDDLWKKDFLKKTCDVLAKRSNVGLVHTRLTIFSMQGRAKKLSKDHRIYRSSREMAGIDCIVQFLEKNWQVSQPSASVFRSECIKKLGLMTEAGFDTEYWNRICSSFDFYYIDESLCLMREHAHRSTAQETDLIRFYSVMIFMIEAAAIYRMTADKEKLLKKSMLVSYARYRQYIVNELTDHPYRYLKPQKLRAIVSLYCCCAPIWFFIPDLIAARFKGV